MAELQKHCPLVQRVKAPGKVVVANPISQVLAGDRNNQNVAFAAPEHLLLDGVGTRSTI